LLSCLQGLGTVSYAFGLWHKISHSCSFQRLHCRLLRTWPKNKLCWLNRSQEYYSCKAKGVASRSSGFWNPAKARATHSGHGVKYNLDHQTFKVTRNASVIEWHLRGCVQITNRSAVSVEYRVRLGSEPIHLTARTQLSTSLRHADHMITQPVVG